MVIIAAVSVVRIDDGRFEEADFIIPHQSFFVYAVTSAISFLLTRPLVSVFARPDDPVYDLAVTGNRICTIALFFIGFNIFASGMFTALSTPAAELMALALSVYMFLKYRKRYGY